MNNKISDYGKKIDSTGRWIRQKKYDLLARKYNICKEHSKFLYDKLDKAKKEVFDDIIELCQNNDLGFWELDEFQELKKKHLITNNIDKTKVK